MNCLSFFVVSSRISSTPLYPQSVMNQGACLDYLFFRYFHFRFPFESIKELENASYGMTRCKPISIPLEQNVKLSVDKGNLMEDTTMYRHIVGSLIYMTITRLDLNYVVGVVNQFMQTPRKPHLDAMRHILRYIKHSLQCGIFYEAKS